MKFGGPTLSEGGESESDIGFAQFRFPEPVAVQNRLKVIFWKIGFTQFVGLFPS
jgi:hypothetical protein